jgi:hypothetical protein
LEACPFFFFAVSTNRTKCPVGPKTLQGQILLAAFG